MEYIVAKTTEVNPGIASSEWDRAEIGQIADEPWVKDYSPSPKTTFKLLRGPEGISVLFHTDETNLRAEVKEQNGEVCMDSCMEFFFKPSPWDERYINFEVNPAGVMHIGLGSGRHNRTLLYDDRAIFDVVSVANDGDWTLKYYIPDAFLKKYFPASSENCSCVAKGNFYKCGEGTDHSHFATWSRVETAKPDFHLADFFGKIVFKY